MASSNGASWAPVPDGVHQILYLLTEGGKPGADQARVSGVVVVGCVERVWTGGSVFSTAACFFGGPALWGAQTRTTRRWHPGLGS